MANKRQKKGAKKTNLDSEIRVLNECLNDLSCENSKNKKTTNNNEKSQNNVNAKTAKKTSNNNNAKRGKRWNDGDVKKLKVVVKVVDPKTEEHWKLVAGAVGRKSETECKDKAEKLGLLRVDVQSCSNDDEENICNIENESSGQPADFFNELNDKEYSLDLNADDSLLYIMLTPEQRVRFPRRPFIPRQLTDQSTARIDTLDLDISI